MLDRSALKSFYPLVATPCYGGALYYTYVTSIIQLISAAQSAQMTIYFIEPATASSRGRAMTAWLIS